MKPIDQAVAAHRSGDLTTAEQLYRNILAADARDFDALHMLGIIHAQRGQLETAAALLGDAIAVNSSVVPCLHNHGNVLYRLGRHEDAIASYRKALHVAPAYPPLYSDLGNALAALDRLDEAMANHDRAVQLNPRSAEVHYNRGTALSKLAQHEAAIGSYNWAIALERNHAEAHCSRGVALAHLNRYDEAVLAFEQALALKPELKALRGQHHLAKRRLCDWRNFDNEVSRLLAATRSGQFASWPFVLVSTPATAADQLQCARRYAADFPSLPPLWRGEIYAHDRIRIAYLSSDLRDHAIGHVTAGLFEQHDTSRFEVTAIAYGADQPESDLRRRLKASFEHFIAVGSRTDQDIATLIRAREIDIAIDLNGYTDGMRPHVLLRRPAPIQVSYLGFPGTMADGYIDYAIADATVLPADQYAGFGEKIVSLPDSYQVNDNRRRIAERTPTRAECGLPETGFVFCCFNAAYKLTPAMFDIWMRLVKAIPDSVIWLVDEGPTTTANLRREAEARGVAAARLVFAARVSLPDYLARHRLADLFLDTLPYNAHGTASGALWGGLPILTCLGATFAGRVGASLLRAIGLPELITTSLEDYEAAALALARDPVRLAGLRAKLARNLPTEPLFDTKRFARNIESAYTTMWQRYQRGEPPESFAVAPVPAA